MASDSITVLVGVGVDGFLEGLAQYVLAALGVGDEPVDRQHQVVGNQRIGGREKPRLRLTMTTLVVGQALLGLPQVRYVRGHVHFLRHPVIGAAVDDTSARPSRI